MGSVVDERKFSIEVCYPLALCRTDPHHSFSNSLLKFV
jgi:hypothetical protein